MLWAMRRPVWVLLATCVVSALALTQLPKLEIAISPQSLIIEGDPKQSFLDDVRDTFGSDRITIVYLSDRNLFAPQKLRAIATVVESIERLPFVAKTRSLFSVPDLRVRDEFVVTDPFLATVPDDAETLNAIIERAKRNPFVERNLLSQDGRSMAVNVYLRPQAGDADPSFDDRVSKAISEAIRPLSGQLDQAYQIGLPYVRSAIADTVAAEQVQTIAAALLVLVVVLFLLFRRLSALLIPVITASLSIVWLLGGMAALGIPLTILTAIVPVLLIIVGSTEDVHLLAETFDGQREGLALQRAIRRTVRRLGLAIGLTFVTSYLGFLAIGANPIALVRDFGLVSSTGLAINFFITATLVPILLRLLGSPTTTDRVRWGAVLFDNVSRRITRVILAYRRSVLVASLLLLSGLLYLAASVEINNDILSYFGPESPVQQRATTLKNELSGIYTLQIVVDGHIDNAFERPAFLEELHEIQNFIAEHPRLDHSNSFADYIALLNSAVNDTGTPELPYDDDVVENLTLFINPGDADEYISSDLSVANILVRHGISESAVLGEVIKELEDFVDRRIDKDLAVTITGESVLTKNAVGYLMKGQLRSLMIVLVAIFIVVSLLFLTVKAGVIAVAVNLFPIAALFALMGYFGIPVDSATSMIAALAVGIGVDHTMHFMVRYSLHARRQQNERHAVSLTLQDEARPIGAATLALSAGFATLALSGFPPIFYFGVLSAITMIFSFLATFVLAPVLLSYIRLNTLWEILGTRVRYELKQNCALFRDMSTQQIRRIILQGNTLDHRDGDVIMQYGDHGDTLFVLLSGSVVVESGKPGQPSATVQAMSTGEVFGVAALMCGRPRVASARAVGETTVLALDWRRLQRIARIYPRSAYLLFRNLSTIMGERLTERVAAEDNSRGPLDANDPDDLAQPVSK
ncbi:MAG: efflux RND transporter permease subunit [Gammaproteobacteria bacterium]|nr:efflux RND transporter permease subunit [Gammaproteobacteria bacterium]